MNPIEELKSINIGCISSSEEDMDLLKKAILYLAERLDHIEQLLSPAKPIRIVYPCCYTADNQGIPCPIHETPQEEKNESI